MRIALSVHGRFSAFGIAQGLLQLGQDVTVYTNYPAWAVERFGIPRDRARTFVLHALAARFANRTGLERRDSVEALIKTTFGKWASRELQKGGFDAIDCWSGCAEEPFHSADALKMLTRSSAHIAVQRDLLRAESERVKAPVEHPGDWIVERELREYELADVIIVPSTFAASTFAATPHAQKVRIVRLTAAPSKWRPQPDVIEARRQRAREREPLRVLYVGAVSFRKGIYDLASVARERTDVQFRLVGHANHECRDLLGKLGPNVRIDGHVPEQQLVDAYAWADVFLFPSIEDGFGVVLAQAQGAALPFISTRNTGAPDLLAMGGAGWLVEARDTSAMLERVAWCSENRAELAEMSARLFDNPIQRTWTDVAHDELAVVQTGVASR